MANELLDELGFPSSPAQIAERTRNSPGQIRTLMQVEAPLANRAVSLLGVVRVGKPPSFDVLPEPTRKAVMQLGFTPVCHVSWGVLPVLMRTPQWVGPDGFTKLEYYRQSGNVYLNTLFDDGSALTTGRSGNANTEVLTPSGDFERDYREHLKRVRERCDLGVSTIYRPTAELVAESFRLFYLWHFPTASAAFAALQPVFLVALVVLTIWFMSAQP